MKRIFLTKTIGMLGMLATLSALVGSVVQQPAKAQERLSVAEWQARSGLSDADIEVLVDLKATQVGRSVVRAIPSFCTPAFEGGVSSGLPPQYFDEDGNFRSYAFFGIELTPEQQAVFQQADQRLSDRATALNLELEQEVIPNGSIDYFTTDPDGGIPLEISDELSAAVTAVNIDDIANAEQLDELTERFGQYKVEFTEAAFSTFTPEQILEEGSSVREFTVTMAAALTPEQREIFLKNLDAGSAVASCSPRPLAQSVLRRVTADR
jgi:Spy/CpxP family protein refolding chaperone